MHVVSEEALLSEWTDWPTIWFPSGVYVVRRKGDDVAWADVFVVVQKAFVEGPFLVSLKWSFDRDGYVLPDGITSMSPVFEAATVDRRRIKPYLWRKALVEEGVMGGCSNWRVSEQTLLSEWTEEPTTWFPSGVYVVRRRNSGDRWANVVVVVHNAFSMRPKVVSLDWSESDDCYVLPRGLTALSPLFEAVKVDRRRTKPYLWRKVS